MSTCVDRLFCLLDALTPVCDKCVPTPQVVGNSARPALWDVEAALRTAKEKLAALQEEVRTTNAAVLRVPERGRVGVLYNKFGREGGSGGTGGGAGGKEGGATTAIAASTTTGIIQTVVFGGIL